MVFKSILFALMLILCNPLQAHDCKSVFVKAFVNLPDTDTPAWLQIRDHIRASLHPETGPGFAILDLSPFYSMDELNAFLARSPQTTYDRNYLRTGKSRIIHNHTLLSDDFSAMQLESLNRLSRWMWGLLEASLSGPELTGLFDWELRYSRTSQPPLTLPIWHIDGSANLTILFTARDSGPEIYPDTPKLDTKTDKAYARQEVNPSKIISAPEGSLVILSSEGRGQFYESVKPTLHRSPLTVSPKRVLFLMRHYR